jgi:hypothetical protein
MQKFPSSLGHAIHAARTSNLQGSSAFGASEGFCVIESDFRDLAAALGPRCIAARGVWDEPA